MGPISGPESHEGGGQEPSKEREPTTASLNQPEAHSPFLEELPSRKEVMQA